MTGNQVRGLRNDKGENEQERIVSNFPLRQLSEPRDIAAAVAFLVSEEANYITDITLNVGGGRYLR